MTGNPLELFRKLFGAVRAIFWLWGSLLAPDTWEGTDRKQASLGCPRRGRRAVVRGVGVQQRGGGFAAGNNAFAVAGKNACFCRTLRFFLWGCVREGRRGSFQKGSFRQNNLWFIPLLFPNSGREGGSPFCSFSGAPQTDPLKSMTQTNLSGDIFSIEAPQTLLRT